MSDLSEATAWSSLGCSSLTGMLALFYFLLLLMARWFWIMAPSRRQLRSQVEGFRVRLQTQFVQEADRQGPGTPRALAIAQVWCELESLIESLEGRKCLRDLVCGTDVYLKYWRIYHSLQVRAVYFDEAACLRWLKLSPESMIGVPGTPHQIKTLQELVATRDQQSSPPPDATNMAATLANFAYEYRDTYYGKLADWNNKVAWLVIVALFFVISLAAADGEQSRVLLIGALGGLLAKLRSSIYRADVPTDYGASWTTLFLIPLVGALTGWAGIALVHMLAEISFLIEPKLTSRAATPGLALLFGYGATLFDKLAVNASTKLANP